MKNIGIKSIFIGLICLFYMHTYAYKQQTMNVNYVNEKFTKVISDLYEKTGENFLYNHNEVKDVPLVTLELKDASISEILQYCLRNTNLEFRKRNGVYVISPKKQLGDKYIVIKGHIKALKGGALYGATVILKGTTIGIATDKNGNFELKIPKKENSILQFSFAGMKTKEIKINNTQLFYDIVLKEDEQQLDDVVVTGIFKKANTVFTGATTFVTDKEIKSFGDKNLISTLANIDPSFNILANNDFGSDPNKLPELQIRGTSSILGIDEIKDGSQAQLNLPLIILDGFEISLQKMMDLNSEDVESVTLLKDGSATALYGSRGAHGIIVIKTNAPKEGKLKFTYQGNINIELPDLTDYNLLNAKDKLKLEYESGFYNSYYNPEERELALRNKYSKILADVERGVNTYWLSKPLRIGVGNRHNMKIEGGDAKFRYSATAQYNHIAGVMKESNRDNFNGGINLSYRHKNLMFMNSVMIGYNEAKESPYGSFSQYTKLNPYWKPYDDNGRLLKFFDTDDYFWGGRHPQNPLYNSTLYTINKTSYTSIINNLSIEWEPLKALKFRGRLGINYEIDDSDNFKSKSHTDFDTDEFKGEGLLRRGRYVYGTGKKRSYYASLTISYYKMINDAHNIYIGFNTDISDNNYKNYSFTVEGFTQESPKHLAMAMQYMKNGKPTGGETVNRRLGFVGNLNYSFKNKYFTDLSFRVDGSSQFGRNKRYAPFYSFGIGWNMHNEDFIMQYDMINRLKLRASFGQNGTQRFQSYQAISMYDYYLNDRYYEWVGVYQKALENPNLEWQKTNKYNLGIDSDLLYGRLSISADIYREKTSNLLSSRELPWSNGFTSYIENIGQLQNDGFELKFKGIIIRDTENEFIWNITTTIAHNRNKMIKISDALKSAYEKRLKGTKKMPLNIVREGESLSTIYTMHSLGIDPSNGEEIFLKRNGEVTYKWSADDLMPSGQKMPKYRGTINSVVRYKRFMLNLAFAYHWGGQLYNSTLVSKIENSDKRYNVDYRVFSDSWRKVGDIAKFKRINSSSVSTNTYATSRFVQDDNVFTCKNINISYELRDNKKLKNNYGISSMILSANASDIFYWSTVPQERGIGYPFSRRFSLSLSLLF